MEEAYLTVASLYSDAPQSLCSSCSNNSLDSTRHKSLPSPPILQETRSASIAAGLEAVACKERKLGLQTNLGLNSVYKDFT